MKYVIALAGHSICQIDAATDQKAVLEAEGRIIGFLADVFGELAQVRPSSSEIARRTKVEDVLEKAFPGFQIHCDIGKPSKVAGTNVWTPINVTLRAS